MRATWVVECDVPRSAASAQGCALLAVPLVAAHLVLRRRCFSRGHPSAWLQPGDLAAERIRVRGGAGVVRSPVAALRGTRHALLTRGAATGFRRIGVGRVLFRMVGAHGYAFPSCGNSGRLISMLIILA